MAQSIPVWTVTDTSDNAIAVATKAAEVDTLKHHNITSISGSFNDNALVKLLTLKDGTTVIGNWYVNGQFALTFLNPIRISPGALAKLELAASGTGGKIGAVTMTGFTRR